MTLAEIILATNSGDVTAMAGRYLHRAVREDTDGLLKGRERLMEARRAEVCAAGPGDGEILADLGEMVEHRTTDGRIEHRWIEVEDQRISRETIVASRSLLLSDPSPMASLGELSEGRGQFAASAEARLPADFPPDARAAADRLHNLWNGRALPASVEDELPTDEALLALLRTALPDATLLIVRGLARDGVEAVLWRLHGHHLGPGLDVPPKGRRVRVFGSSVMQGGAHRAVVDWAALHRQLQSPESGAAHASAD